MSGWNNLSPRHDCRDWSILKLFLLTMDDPFMEAISIEVYCSGKASIHPASRGNAAPHRRFFWPTQTYIQKISQTHCFFNVFTMCSVENTVIYAVFGIKSVQNSGFCSVFKALASKKIQCRDLPRHLKTPLFTLFSSNFPCANAAGQLKHIYKKFFQNIVFSNVFTSKTP